MVLTPSERIIASMRMLPSLYQLVSCNDRLIKFNHKCSSFMPVSRHFRRLQTANTHLLHSYLLLTAKNFWQITSKYLKCNNIIMLQNKQKYRQRTDICELPSLKLLKLCMPNSTETFTYFTKISLKTSEYWQEFVTYIHKYNTYIDTYCRVTII